MGNLAGQNGLPDDNSESSQTLAVISPATITLTGNDAASREAAEELTRRDPETANQALTDTLTLQDAARIERQMQEAKQNAAAANLIGQTVAGLIGDLADQMKKPINDATLRQALDEKQAAADKGGPPLTNVEQYELNRLNGEGMSSEKAAQTLANPEAWANYDNWQEGSLNKTILHGLAGIIQAKVGDGNALVGAAAGALNEALLPEMEKFLDAQNITDPEARKGYLQLGSALLGAGLGAVADGTNGAALGGTVAYNATTYNYLTHEQIKKKQNLLTKAKTDEERQQIEKEYADLDARQRDEAAQCLLSKNCSSIMLSVALQQTLAELEASCAPPRLCSTDAKASIAELRGLYSKIGSSGVRWGEVINNTMGVVGSGAGIIVGAGLLGAPEPTMATKAAGTAVISKSIYSWSTSWYGLARAFSGDVAYDIPGQYQTLPRAVVASLGSSSYTAQRVADVLDLGVDFASGRIPVGYFQIGPGYKMLYGYSGCSLTELGFVSNMMTPGANKFVNTMQILQTIQYSREAFSK